MFGKLFKKAASSAKGVEIGVETEAPVEGEELGDVEGVEETEEGFSVGVSTKGAAKAARGLGRAVGGLGAKKGGGAA